MSAGVADDVVGTVGAIDAVGIVVATEGVWTVSITIVCVGGGPGCIPDDSELEASLAAAIGAGEPPKENELCDMASGGSSVSP